MLCQTCGKETPEQGLYCLNCGTRVNKECPRCAEIIRVKARICRFCGYELTVQEIAQMESEEQEKARRKQEGRERAEQQQADSKRLGDEERERAESERKRWEEETDYAKWHRPDVVRKWGPIILQCPVCSFLNPPRGFAQDILLPKSTDKCRHCSASLQSAQSIKNPYW
jgi:Double zinc ribbon